MVETLFLLVAAKNVSELLEQISRQRSSQPWIIFSVTPTSATEPVSESPMALSLFEVKSKAFERVRLKFFSDGDPIEDPIPESTGEEGRRLAFDRRASSKSRAERRLVAGLGPRAPEKVCSKSAITSLAASRLL